MSMPKHGCLRRNWFFRCTGLQDNAIAVVEYVFSTTDASPNAMDFHRRPYGGDRGALVSVGTSIAGATEALGIKP